MRTEAEAIEFSTGDGRILRGDWLRADEPRATAVLHSATGVPRGFYRAFATTLAQSGIDTLIWDARGIGDSATLPMRQDPATMRDWGQRDQPAALAYARAAHPSRPLILIGHSSGGHLCGLNRETAQVDAIVLIAAGGCDWRDYPRAQQPRLLATWCFAMPALLAIFGHLPAWAGIGQALPRAVARDWRRWSLRRGYLFSDASLDRSGYAAYRGALLMLSMDDDLGFAPPRAVHSLLAQFTNALIEHRQLRSSEGHRGRIGHFGFFKSDNAPLWCGVIDWLQARVMKA